MKGDAVEDDLSESGEDKVVEVEDMITVLEYEEALARMKNGKSPGEDGVSMELIREGGERLK